MSFKKYGKRTAFLAVMATMLALILTLSSCLPFPQKFKSDTEEHKHIQAENLKSTASDVVDIYEKLFEADKKDALGGDVSVELELSDEALNMIELLADVDLSWLSKVGINLSAATKDSLTEMDMGISLSDSELISLAVVLDMSSKMVYMTIPEILTKYLAVELPIDIPEITLDTEKLPAPNKVENLLDKYIDLAIGALGEVEKTDGSLTANGVEQKCRVYEVRLNERVAREMVTVLVGEAKVDADLKEVIVAFGDWIVELVAGTGEYVEATGETIYENFTEACSELLEEVNSDAYYDTSLSSEEAYEDSYRIISYVDGDGEIIGRKVVYDDSTVASYGYTENKGNFGFELVVEDEAILVGEGTVGKKLNGTFTLTGADVDYLTVTISDLDMDKLDDGYINGKFDISLDAIADEFGSAASILSVYSVRLELESSENSGKMVLALMSGENYFAKLTLSSKAGKVDAPKVPAEDKVIVVNEDTDPSALLAEIDFDVLLEKLKNSAIPAEYVSMIEQYVSLFQLIG